MLLDMIQTQVQNKNIRRGEDPATEGRVLNPLPCRVGLVVSVSASHTVGREFASRPGHTKDHDKNGTNWLIL